MKNLFKILIACIVPTFIFSCLNTSEEELFSLEIEGEVSFQNDVIPVFEQQCFRCHRGPDNSAPVDINFVNQNGGGFVYADYQTILEASLDSLNGIPFILGNIEREDPDFLPMPFSEPKIPADQIEIIRRWFIEGRQNN